MTYRDKQLETGIRIAQVGFAALFIVLLAFLFGPISDSSTSGLLSKAFGVGATLGGLWILILIGKVIATYLTHRFGEGENEQ